MAKRALYLLLVAPVLTHCDCGEGSLARLRPDIEASPNPVRFDTPPLSATARSVVTVRNGGDWRLTVDELVVMDESSAGFALAPDAAATPFELGPSEERAISVQFSPVRLADAAGVLAIRSDDPDTPSLEVALIAERRTGAVLATCVESADLGLAATCGSTLAVAFGPRGLGTEMRATVRLSSEGTEPVLIMSAAFDADTAIEADALAVPVTLAVGESRSIEVRFEPWTGGLAEGALEVRSSDPEHGRSSVSFSGTGVESGLCFDPPALDFGAVAVGSSTEKTVSITSCGSAEVELTRALLVEAGAEFVLVDPPTTPIPLVPGGPPYLLRVRYAPASLGMHQNRVRVESGAGSNVVPLTGRAAGCAASVLPTALVWDAESERGYAKEALLQNDGGAACEILDVAVVGSATVAFHLGNPPGPASLAPGDSIDLELTYYNDAHPDQRGFERAELHITFSNHSELVVPLSAEDTQHLPCSMQIDGLDLDFGATPIGSRRSMRVGLANLGTETCMVSNVELRSAHRDFHLASVVGGPFDFLHPYGEILVDYLPTEVVEATGVLHFETSDPAHPSVDIPLHGRTLTSNLCVEPTQLPFGDTQTSSTRTFVISACGVVPVTIDGLGFSLPDPEFDLAAPPSIPFTLAPGETRSVQVRYQPSDSSPDSAEITVSTTDPFEADQIVRATGGPLILPPSAGSFLYFWRAREDGPFLESEIWKQPLQGDPTPSFLVGGGGPPQHRCYACHVPSPDGRFIFIEDVPAPFEIYDTLTSTTFSLPYVSDAGSFLSWNPDVNTNPPYQFVYTFLDDLQVGSIYQGHIGPLSGASDPNVVETMPSWGSNGQIAFVRSTGEKSLWTIEGDAELYLIDEGGGVAQPIQGASGSDVMRYYPEISPDGNWIAFTYSPGSNTHTQPDAQIGLVRTDQSGTVANASALNGTAGASTFPTWSRDGQFLSFSSTRMHGGSDYDIFVAPFDASAATAGAAVPISAINTTDFEHSARWGP